MAKARRFCFLSGGIGLPASDGGTLSLMCDPDEPTTLRPVFMAVGGFILILGLLMFLLGVSNWSYQSYDLFSSHGLQYGMNLELFGVIISPTGAAILLYGIAARPPSPKTES